jgi:hypothetical protein
VAPGNNPFEHPDAMRRFRMMKNVEELALALEYPWERWAVFLHPEAALDEFALIAADLRPT